MGKEYIAGVSFSDNAAQVAVLKLRRDNITVVHLEEYKNGMNDDLWFLESLLKNRKTFKNVSKVSVALEGGSVFQHSFPMDAPLTHQEQGEHVQWELANFLQDFDPREYINDVHVVRTHAEERYSDMFVISARRSFVKQIQHALDEHKYDLHLLDTNHFAGQYALLVNYPEVKSTTLVLASVSEQRVDAGVLHEGRLVGYRYFINAHPSELAKCLREFCNEVSETHLYLYGGGCDFAFMKTLQASVGLKITKVNPFRRLAIASSLRKSGLMIGQEHKFVASIGVALRKE